MKKIVCGFMALIVMVNLSGCGTSSDSDNDKNSDLKEVTLVLDYVPNTNHTGLYIAQDKGYFSEEGLKVNIIEPGDNNTSAAMVATNQGQFGVSYQEDVTYALTQEQPMPIKAIATIMQHNTSGFVSLKEKNIKTPKDFEGKTYAGWQSLSEEAVIKAIMQANGADFSKLTMVGSDGSGIMELENKVDLLWVFEGWDIAKAKMDNYELDYTPLRDLDERLDYYTPVIISNKEMMENDPETVTKFMNAVSKGYNDAIKDPNGSAEILHKYAPDYEIEFLKESQIFLSAQYAKDAEKWGIMKDSVWNNYTEFMFENDLITENIEAKDQYTNEFIK